MNEKFEINGVSYPFTEKKRTDGSITKFEFEEGKMNLAVLVEPFEFMESVHKGVFKEHLGKVYVSIYISSICFPTDKVALEISYPSEDLHFFSINGFDEPDNFHGELKISQGVFSMIGEMRSEYSERMVPIQIIKKFKEGIVDSIHFEFVNKNYTSVESKFVKNAVFSKEIPTDITSLDSLVKLRITNFEGTELPDVFSNFPNLKELALFELPNVYELPPSLFELNKLEKLYLGNAGIKSIPPDISGFHSLKEFTIYNIKMNEVPEELFLLPKLETVLLRYMNLKSLPSTFAQAKHLKQVYLEGNKFKELPNALSQMEVSIENKYKKLFINNTYPNNANQLINNGLFKAKLDGDTLEDYNKLIKKYDLESFQERLLAAAQKSVSYYTTQAEDYKEKGNTRFGGCPDLPKGMTYPMTDDKHWIFLAQLNLADIAEYQDYLPKTGRLYFFAEDLEYVENVKVIFDDSKEMTTYAYPDNMVFIDSNQDVPFDAFKTEVKGGYSLPHLFNVSEVLGMNKKATIAFEENHYDDYLVLMENLYATNNNGPHSINNYVFTQNESVEEQAASKKGGEASEWMTLLSLNYDRQTGFTFWDAGTLNFVIHKKDLVVQDFSNVMAFIESS